MEIREVSVERREATGKGAVRRLRRQGLVPAVLYGARTEPVALSLSPKEIQRALHGHAGGGVLVSLKLAGEAEARSAVVRDLQFDPVRETLIHVDLQAVRMDEEITVEVPIHPVGDAAGVKEQSGVLAVLLRTVEVACLPTRIPDRLDVDVSALRIHDVITVGDIPPPEGVRLTTPANQAVITVAPPMAEEVAAPTAAAAAEPEVLTERKPEEGAEEGAKPEAKGRETKEAREDAKPKKEK
ncbi:MAG: 50S ribosomal protein L25 [Candidatus Rokuibacteriota bacterium]